jgi:serine/threonine protein kinase
MNDLQEYSIVKKIGEGAFGVVYKAYKKSEPNKYYAIKVEPHNTDSRLEYEVQIYRALNSEIGFPKIYDFKKTKKHNIAIMEYLGPTLEELFEFCNYKFSLKTVLMIGIQILNRIEKVHKLGFLHRDIKPDNFLIGVGPMKNRIYLIDFGLSKRFIDSQSKEHIDYKTNVNFTGSFRFSSIRNHKGIEQSRRDDLESIGYMLIFFLKGKLPWQGLTASTKAKRSKQIYQVKKETSLEILCEGIPKEFLLYMKYCMNLKFTQLPNYEILRNLFISLFKMSNYEMDYIYDWNLVAKFKKQYMYKEE